MMNIEFDIDRLMQEWRINGFVVLEEFIPLETVDRIHQTWVPIRNSGVEQQGRSDNRGVCRYNVRVPFESSFVDEEIFEHLVLVDFLERVLGSDYVWSHLDSNIPLLGAD